jgi:hypothetical protein
MKEAQSAVMLNEFQINPEAQTGCAECHKYELVK